MRSRRSSPCCFTRFSYLEGTSHFPERGFHSEAWPCLAMKKEGRVRGRLGLRCAGSEGSSDFPEIPGQGRPTQTQSLLPALGANPRLCPRGL